MTMGTSLAKSIVAAVVMVMLGGPAMASAGLPARPAVVAQTGATPAATSPVRTETGATEASRYAAREQKAQKLENFKGGAAIYIGASAVALAALIVLLLVLI
jgi:hypothetical protein